MLRPLVAAVLLAAPLAVAGTPPPTLRLPDGASPRRYVVHLAIDPAAPTFRGEIDIDLTLTRPLDVLWLNGSGLTIRRATVESRTVRWLAGGDEFIGFAGAAPFPAGPARLHVEYQGKLQRTDANGLLAQQEAGRWYAITELEPTYARRVFPCFDEPRYKVPWELVVEAPRGLTVLANTRTTGERALAGGRTQFTFAPTAPLPSYLFAVAVGPFDLVDAGRSGSTHAPVRIAVPAGRGVDARWAAESTGALLDLLERYFGTPYPYGKLDIATIPLAHGAMENPGLITFGQRLVVTPRRAEGLSFRRRYASVAAHELAHQWFGDLVTPAWWDDLWLNESFASWLGERVIAAWQPGWSAGAGSVEARQSALAADTLQSARRIREPITGSDDIQNAFDAITYSKGESVLTMFERWLGPDTFQRGVRAFIAAHANGTATSGDFVSAMSDAAHRDLRGAFASFLDQPGAPLLDVELACAAGTRPALLVRQQRYVALGASAPAERWQVPLCVRWIAGPREGRTCALITDEKQRVELDAPSCPEWLLANDGGSGYYRSAQPAPMRAKLLGEGGRSHLTLAESAVLLDDLDALARAGRIPLGEALALAAPFAADPRRLLATAVLHLVDALDEEVISDGARPHLARWVGTLFRARARALGWQPHDGDSEDTRLLRAPLLETVAEVGDDAELQAEAGRLARRWLDDRAAVSPDVLDAVLRVAAIHGDRALFDRMRAEVGRAAERQDRWRLLRVLGLFRSPELSRAGLALAFSTDRDPRESIEILVGALQERVARPLAWAQVEARWDDLARRLPPELMAQVPAVASELCDEQQALAIDRALHERMAKLPGGPRELAQAVDEIRNCGRFAAQQRASAEAFLARF